MTDNSSYIDLIKLLLHFKYLTVVVVFVPRLTVSRMFESLDKWHESYYELRRRCEARRCGYLLDRLLGREGQVHLNPTRLKVGRWPRSPDANPSRKMDTPGLASETRERSKNRANRSRREARK